MKLPQQIDRQLSEHLVPSPNRAASSEHPSTWHDDQLGLHVYPIEVLDPLSSEPRQDIDMAIIELEGGGRSPVTILRSDIEYSARRWIMSGRMMLIKHNPIEGVTFCVLDADSTILESHYYELAPGDTEVLFAIDGECQLLDESRPPFRSDFEDVVADDDPRLPEDYRRAIAAVAGSDNPLKASNDFLIHSTEQ